MASGANHQHPLMAFAAECRMVVTAWLRPGDSTRDPRGKNFFRKCSGLWGSAPIVGYALTAALFGSFLDLVESQKRVVYSCGPVMRTIKVASGYKTGSSWMGRTAVAN